MNVHIVVEGNVGEKNVYQHWVPFVNSNLTYVESIFDVKNNHFSIVSGMGYPQYFDVIKYEIENVNEHGNIDRFVIAVDTEEMTYEEKLAEISAYVSPLQCKADKIIVLQNFCLETWGLGNSKLIKKNPDSSRLREFKDFYDVSTKDPENLPEYNGFSRVAFATVYLRNALLERHRNISYSKRNPTALLHPKYFKEVQNRLEQTGHIQSFEGFLNAFS